MINYVNHQNIENILGNTLKAISIGIIITRSIDLDEVFRSIKVNDKDTLIKKYGASTTHLKKLLPRLKSRRNGGCPILAIGIRKNSVIDYKY